jgi:hypothetical protein
MTQALLPQDIATISRLQAAPSFTIRETYKNCTESQRNVFVSLALEAQNWFLFCIELQKN